MPSRVAVPMVLLRLRGEAGSWTATGTIWSLIAGAPAALGALGVILAFRFGGNPLYVMPLVFGGAPVVNTICHHAAGPELSAGQPALLCRPDRRGHRGRRPCWSFAPPEGMPRPRRKVMETLANGPPWPGQS